MQPKIGIPLGFEPSHSNRRYERIERTYVEALNEAGALSFALPLQRAPEQLISEVDALLLPGGNDFAPSQWYSLASGAPYPREAFHLAPRELIEFQAALFAAALQAKKPVLGICFGMQLMALQSGGTLHYHLPSDLCQAQPHQLQDPDVYHRIQIESDSFLARALGHTETTVNSRHHQAIAQVGTDWKVAARSRDGVIEAMEHTAHPFCLGVQWHPENMHELHRRALFEKWVEATRSART